MRFAKKLALAPALMAASAAALAHGGHGMGNGTHWHATDTAGLVLVALLAGLAIFFTRGK